MPWSVEIPPDSLVHRLGSVWCGNAILVQVLGKDYGGLLMHVDQRVCGLLALGPQSSRFAVVLRSTGSRTD
ncbi:hypothetical protein GCM10010392_65220 [Streptomyces clavifer]|nr:hypothetical protein GCM10010392_65220 [Streptomyces clavifer]